MSGADWRVNAGNDFVPDPVGAFEHGRSMADMQNVRAERQARAAQDQYQHGRQVQQDTRDDQFREASKSMYEMGEDGSVGINPNGMPKIFGADPAKAYAMQQQVMQDQAKARLAKLDEVKKQNDMQAQLLNGVEDQRGWDMALANAQKFGLPGIEQLPKVYDKGLVKQLQFRSLDLKDRLDLERKSAESALGMEKTRAEIGKIKAETGATYAKAGAGPGKSEGIKALDKEFAKDFNEWTSGGEKLALSEIQKLRSVSERLSSGEVTTGGMTGFFPDRVTSNKVLSARADIQATIMKSLRAILGAAFTEKEGERVIKNTWNESDSTENNMVRVNRLADDLENQARDKAAKARYFAKNKTLDEFKMGGSVAENPPRQGKAAYEEMSDAELLRQYNERVRGANADSR
jgi:hypothetical protein